MFSVQVVHIVRLHRTLESVMFPVARRIQFILEYSLNVILTFSINFFIFGSKQITRKSTLKCIFIQCNLFTYKNSVSKSNHNRRQTRFHFPDNSTKVVIDKSIDNLNLTNLNLLLKFEEIRSLSIGLNIIQKNFFGN